MSPKHSRTREPKSLAVFDFDGTITRTDSFNHFLISQFGYVRFIFYAFLQITDVIYSLFDKKYAYVVQENFLKAFYGGKKYSVFENDAVLYARDRLDSIVRASALEKLLHHTSEQHTVVVISASPKVWIQEWAGKLGISCVYGSELEEIDGNMTGRFSKRYWGPSKAKLVENLAEKYGAQYIYAYGDSIGDKDMLHIADESYYRFFND